MTTHLSFTVGPVQGFVAQARRTRDLWAGSWLLSYLAERALAAAEQARETAIIPHRDKAQQGKLTAVESPIGGIPNRFELTFESQEKAKAAAEAAEKAFHEAWRSVANAVWNQYVAHAIENGNGTKEIWSRQVENFWELSWVIREPDGDAKTIGRFAAARKQFRNAPATAEPGVKCSLMGDMQEISGCTGDRQNEFWLALAKRTGSHDFRVIEGRDGKKRCTERLCAIALIKRLFPRVIDEAFPTGEGYAVREELRNQTGWPSTAFFAVLPWLNSLKGESLDQAQQFAKNAAEAKAGKSEQQAAQDAGIPWANIDAPAWFRTALQQNEWRIEDDKRNELIEQLRAVYKQAGREPIPYYALLLMDGDSMGNLLNELGDPSKLSKCLGKFADEVHNILSEHNGRTIYAGGDDVLAMLPAEGALKAAAELAQKYTETFQNTDAHDKATLSGALVYTHWKFPLRQAITTAHYLLDDIAKERTGRDALAIGIVQGSGLSAVWAAPWKVLRGEQGAETRLDELIDDFGTDDANPDAAEFNASYLYNLREQFRRLFPDFREEPGQFAALPEALTAASNGDSGALGILGDIAHAEYRRRLSKTERLKTPPHHTEPKIERLMALSQRVTHDRNGQVQAHPDTFTFDGWRVARFLKQVKEGRMTGHE